MIYYHLCYHLSGAPSKDTPEWWRMHQEELGFDRSGIDEKNVNSANQYLRGCNCYVALITGFDIETMEINIYVACSVCHMDKFRLEEIVHPDSDKCKWELDHQEEITVEAYKYAVDSTCYNTRSSVLFEKFGIDFREPLYDPFPFRVEEKILEEQTLTLEECRQRAHEILGSSSLYEELDRIYSPENQQIYKGHPVHYLISAGAWGAAEDIYELLIKALYNNKRLISNRITLFREVQRKGYKDSRYQKVIEAGEGGTVIIELKSNEGMGRFATDFHEFTKRTGEILEKQKKDTLFIFVEITGKSLNDDDAIDNILKKADIIQITEGTGTLQDARNYLTELVEQVDFGTEDKSDVYDYLAEAETYSVTDIFNAYNAWYGSGLKIHVYRAYREKKSFQVEVTRVPNKPYDTLQEMIGLTEVKTVIDEIIAASKVVRARERMGLNTQGASFHMMFSGNPGTAKTSVARLLCKILKEESAISSGRFVECGRQDLVAKYVGWTARMVEDKFKEAQGGILFIDEAYALVDSSNTYGAEAINTVVQMMENYRDSVIVIFAGYSEKMQTFLEQNEGLKSRIAFHLSFPDYSPEELTDILTLMSQKRDYQIDEEAKEYCKELFCNAVKEENFGNGRYVRNILDQAIIKQSARILKMETREDISREEICRLKREDFRIHEIVKKSEKRIGFA